MNPSSPTLHLPERRSLAAQTAEVIAKGIESGVWRETLPGERLLCDRLRVSRPTVRASLQILAKQGLLEIRHGRRVRVLAAIPQRTKRQARVVGIVTTEPMTSLSAATNQAVSEMRTYLAAHGFETAVMVCPVHSARTQRRQLEKFVREQPVACCVLLSVSESIQRWFNAQKVPALVLGSCHPDINLPSLDLDYRAVCRHASGTLLSKGHRRIALIVPDSGLAGDLASERGFEAGMLAHRGKAFAIVVRHDGTAPSLTTKLDALFDSPHPPTALLVAKPQHVFIVAFYLLTRGLSVPAAVSLLARDHDPVFALLNPALAHYAVSPRSFTRRLSRLMLELTLQGRLPPRQHLLSPKYIPGRTISRVL